jgi:hypothetical protein
MYEMPTIEAEKISPAESLRSFYETQNLTHYQHEAMMRHIETLEASDPEFLAKTWESTEDLRELSAILIERAQNRIAEHEIQLVQVPMSDSAVGLSTPEGVKQSKLNAPNFFDDPIAYEEFMKQQGNKTPYDGLTPEQVTALLESKLELLEANGYTNTAQNYQFQLLAGRGTIEENRQAYGNTDMLGKLQEKTSLPLNMLMARLHGKIAKLSHAPGFTFDKIKSMVENWLEKPE